MTKKRRIFDVDLPADAPIPVELETKSAMPPRRGPMATAIGEAGEALRRRERIEADIRAENDSLAHEFVRLKKLGLIVDNIDTDLIEARKLTRDRRPGGDLELDELKQSIREIGLSNPIRVEPDGQGGYELVQGLRRLNAYRQLYRETGDPAFKTIPAGLMAAGDSMSTLYRRMVDENLIRKDVSFWEMAGLARAYAQDEVDGCADIDEAVNRLFASATPQKRSYVRRFVPLVRMLEKYLEHPTAISRAVGLQLADRLEADQMGPSTLVKLLQAAPRERSAEDELTVLKAFLTGAKAPVERGRGAPKGRRGRVTLSLPFAPALRCTATQGKMELRATMDFANIERERLEEAVHAFFEVLNKS